MPITIGPEGGVDCRTEVIQHMRKVDQEPPSTAYQWLAKCCDPDCWGFDIGSPWTVDLEAFGKVVLATNREIVAFLPLDVATEQGHKEPDPCKDRKRPNVKWLIDPYFRPGAPFQTPRPIRLITPKCLGCPLEDCDPRVNDECIESGICAEWSRQPLSIFGDPGTHISNRYARLLSEIDSAVELSGRPKNPCRFAGSIGGVEIRGLLVPLNLEHAKAPSTPQEPF